MTMMSPDTSKSKSNSKNVSKLSDYTDGTIYATNKKPTEFQRITYLNSFRTKIIQF